METPPSSAAAEAAGLRYVNDADPGIQRRRAGRGFSYRWADGTPVRDEATLARIAALAIPPGWASVWICADADGHIQATGRDARGRKQYRYHARWRATRDEHKYESLLAFAGALPHVRRQVEADLARPGLPREKVLATLVRLLETTLIRIGNDAYAQANRSFGLTTLRDRHARISGGRVRFQFRGKSGKEHAITLEDRRLARIVARCQELPGQRLFQYLDEGGGQQVVGSGDVNAYLRGCCGAAISAKNFRTWAGTLLAVEALERIGPADRPAQARRRLNQAVREVAERLGNTPTVCRASYIHPAILALYEDGRLHDELRAVRRREIAGLGPDEARLVGLLRRLARQQAAAGAPSEGAEEEP